MAALTPKMTNKDSNKEVLIVDDSKTIRDTLSMLVGAINCHAYTASNGFEALDLLNKQHVDLVITDLTMPKMTGLQLLGEIRKTFNPAQLPVILVSGTLDQFITQQAMAAGVSDVVKKPFEARKLLSVVAKQLAARGSPC